jgi:hypothetical protein
MQLAEVMKVLGDQDCGPAMHCGSCGQRLSVARRALLRVIRATLGKLQTLPHCKVSPGHNWNSSAPYFAVSQNASSASPGLPAVGK